jgi:toxin FitB
MSIWITVITMLEIHFGLELMADGRRKLARMEAFRHLIDQVLERRIAVFDAAAAQETAVLMGARQRRGEPRDLRDSMIAGIALARRAALATHNVKHFDDAGIEIVNPSQG